MPFGSREPKARTSLTGGSIKSGSRRKPGGRFQTAIMIRTWNKDREQWTLNREPVYEIFCAPPGADSGKSSRRLAQERINKELNRRSRVVGAFPNDQSLMRVAGCLLMDINEEWITGKKYLSMEDE